MTETKETEIVVRWTGAWDFLVEVPAAGLTWQIGLAETTGSRLVNATLGRMPYWVWRSEPAVAKIGALAGRLLGTGRLTLSGQAPNGQHFLTMPKQVWTVSDSVAFINGNGLGAPSPRPAQVHLADLALPQRGLFFVGHTLFESLNHSRHLTVTAGRRVTPLTPSIP